MKKQKKDEVTNFYEWLTRTFGKNPNYKKGMKKHLRYIDEYRISTNLQGYEAQIKIEMYIKKYCKKIKFIPCDDAVYASSIIVLIPQQNHGIRMIFVPQCTNVQNEMFLYGSHYVKLMSALSEMKSAYKKDDMHVHGNAYVDVTRTIQREISKSDNKKTGNGKK